MFPAEEGRLLSPARVQGTLLRGERLKREAGAGRAELPMACSGISISGKIALLAASKMDRRRETGRNRKMTWEMMA